MVAEIGDDFQIKTSVAYTNGPEMLHTAYNFALSVQMLFGLVVGGMNSIAGALIGGVMLEFLPGLIADLGKGLSALLFAVLMIAAIVAMPNGIAGLVSRPRNP